MPDPRNVFVVHGRNEAAREAMFAFLRSIGLNPLEWSMIVSATGAASPYTGEVLNNGFKMAQAAVVVMTPDDEARLKKEFWRESDDASETQFQGQVRQNVLLEAGMSLGKFEDRTVLVELGKVRKLTDTLGRHIIRIDNSVAMRQQLAQRLRDAGCSVNLDGTDWHFTGDFAASVAASTSPETAPAAPADSTEMVGPAISAPTQTCSPEALVNLGEHIWYLAEVPKAHVDNVVQTIRGFLNVLRKCELKLSLEAARGLSELTLHYDLRTNLIAEDSRRDVAQMMRPIRNIIIGELRSQ